MMNSIFSSGHSEVDIIFERSLKSFSPIRTKLKIISPHSQSLENEKGPMLLSELKVLVPNFSWNHKDPTRRRRDSNPRYRKVC